MLRLWLLPDCNCKVNHFFGDLNHILLSVFIFCIVNAQGGPAEHLRVVYAVDLRFCFY